jgi:hypothetical protein
MSAQQGTLVGRRTTQIPTWPVIVALVGVIAFSVGTLLPQEGSRELVPVESVTPVQVLENSSAAVREQGATFAGATFDLDPADFRGTSAQVLARYEALVKLGGHALAQPGGRPITIGDTVCHQCL